MKYKFPNFIPSALDRAWCKCISIYDKFRAPLLCRLWGVQYSGRISISGKVFFRARGRNITIGKGCKFISLSRANLVGLMNPTILDTRPNGHIEIGDNCGFSSVVISSHSSVKIGCNITCGGNVRIFDHDFHALDPKLRQSSSNLASTRTAPVEIGDDVFIGTNAIILKGTHLGDRSIIAAGSVVFGLDVPPDSMVKGNPAVITSRNGGR